MKGWNKFFIAHPPTPGAKALGKHTVSNGKSLAKKGCGSQIARRE